MTADLTNKLAALGLGEHREYLLGITRPSIEIITADLPSAMGCSKFGGDPHLPPGFKWPYHKLGPYRFIGQINFADIPIGSHGLPRRGLVSFFYAHDDDGESFWGDPDYVRVFRFDDLDALGPVDTPEAVRLGSTSTITFQVGADVPPWPWDEAAAAAWPIKEFHRDAYWELRLRLHQTCQYLLGYPLNTTLDYNPTPGPDWLSLLTLSSDEDFEWCWHDGDWLVTFIEEHRLVAHDFSRIKADAG